MAVRLAAPRVESVMTEDRDRNENALRNTGEEGGAQDGDERDPVEALDEDLGLFSSVFVLGARKPFADWVQGLEGSPAGWTMRPIDRYQAVLTPELPTQAAADAWLQQNYPEIFVRQLEAWTEDESEWPADRSFDTFLAWFDVMFAPSVDDMRDRESQRLVTCAPLPLARIREEFLQLPLDGRLFVHIETGELFAWTDQEIEAIHAGNAASLDISDDDMRDLQEVFASESFVEIVERTDVDNVETMAAFANTVDSPAIRNRLLNTLQGRRAHRRFRDAIDVAGLRHRWNTWFERTVTDALRDFLADAGVPFVDDVERAEGQRPGED